MTKERLQEFTEKLTGGYTHNEILFLVNDDDGPQMVMFMMDAEWDPVRIVFDSDGAAQLFADGHQWHAFTPDQLRFIARKTTLAMAINDELRDRKDFYDKDFQVADEKWLALKESDFF